MGKLNELRTTQEIVRQILKDSPQARSNDNYLYYAVYATIGRRNGIDLEKMSVPRFFLHLKEYGFPSTETIRRTRQKIQAECPELAGNSTVEGYRVMNEDIFREYARG